MLPATHITLYYVPGCEVPNDNVLTLMRAMCGTPRCRPAFPAVALNDADGGRLIRFLRQTYRRYTIARLAGAALALGTMAGCDTPAQQADATTPTEQAASVDQHIGLDLPARVGRFRRVDVLRREGGADVTAGYSLSDSENVIIATIRVHPAPPSSDLVPLLSNRHLADAAASADALRTSIAQVRHYYPQAELLDPRNAFLVKRGELQAGRAVTLRYQDILAGQRQPIDLDIYMFCCLDDHWAYEYRVRHAAGHDVAPVVIPFMQALPWSSPPGNVPVSTS